jgi:hypothetical protein
MTMTGIRRWGLASVVVLSGWMAGCASITHGTEQNVKLETRTEAGEVVTQADCQMSNDKGTASAPSGVETKVRRSGGNLMVRCTHPNHPAAVGQAISRANVGMVGNIMIGGLIGVAVDAGTGGGFSYPSWMQLVFGQERLFDRIENRGDGPTPGTFVRAAQDPPTARSAAIAGGTARDSGAGDESAARRGGTRAAGAEPARATARGGRARLAAQHRERGRLRAAAQLPCGAAGQLRGARRQRRDLHHRLRQRLCVARQVRCRRLPGNPVARAGERVPALRRARRSRHPRPPIRHQRRTRHE